ncbi:hypothetical protein AAC387_Pa03g4249 [Persea americana]
MEATKKTSTKMRTHPTCPAPCCFFCIMKEQDPSLRSTAIANFFQNMPHRDAQEHVLVLSGLWNIAMAQPNDPEFPSLGIFQCMASLISRGINDPSWLLRHQNIYIPYYAAHVIGSYTMNVIQFAEKAVESGVIPPLLELLRGKLSWVEQRVAVRALGHLASYDRTFDVVARYEEEIVELSMHVASTCLEVVYRKFVGAKDKKKRARYQCDLLTRGMGGVEMENRKAEEWASQLQCWSLYLLNCFACKERCLHLICREVFLKDLCKMWGGLVNDSSPAGVGLLRILCYSKKGRKSVADCIEVVESLCHLSRSSDDWQYMGIDCLLLLIKDPETRPKVLDISAVYLADLVELRDLGGRKRVGEAITESLLLDYKDSKLKYKKGKGVERILQEVWELNVERRNREKAMPEKELEEKRVLVELQKKQGNEKFWSGDVEEAATKYSEAMALCPLKMRKERVVLYSNRAQCHLLMRDPNAAISDATRALCLSRPPNSHKKSLWRRTQAYDMTGLAKESLMDCIMFVNGWFGMKKRKNLKVPYYAARMINKQMNATWLFAGVHCKKPNIHDEEQEDEDEDAEEQVDNDEEEEDEDDDGDQLIIKERVKEKLASIPGLSTILEEPWPKEGRRRGQKKATLRIKEDYVKSCLY